MKSAMINTLLCVLGLGLMSRPSDAQGAPAVTDRGAVNSVVLAMVERLSNTRATAEILRYHKGRQRNVILVTRSGASPEVIARALGTVMMARSHDKKTARGRYGVYSNDDPRLERRIMQYGTADSRRLTSEMRAAAAAYLAQLRGAPPADVRAVGKVPAITVKLAPESS